MEAEAAHIAERLEKAERLVVQAFREWTPTQGPTNKWVAEAKEVKEANDG
jgi:hypothetical protein